VELPEPSTQSFVVKLWAEEIGKDYQWIRWRGHITHVGEGNRRYLDDLTEIMNFIKPYLLTRSDR
jgi:hypothetical protein